MQKQLPVVLINLDRDVERLEFMDGQLRSLSLDYQRFPAILGADLPEKLRPYFYVNGDTTSDLTHGEIGCYASHLSVMQNIIESGQMTLVLEDDVGILPEMLDVIDKIISSNIRFDILRLSSIYPLKYSRKIKSIDNNYDLVKYIKIPPNTGGYILTPRGAEKFLRWKTFRHLPVDMDLMRVWEHRLNTFSLRPTPIEHNVLGTSSIDTYQQRKEEIKKTRLSVYFNSLRRRLYVFENIFIPQMLRKIS